MLFRYTKKGLLALKREVMTVFGLDEPETFKVLIQQNVNETAFLAHLSNAKKLNIIDIHRVPPCQQRL